MKNKWSRIQVWETSIVYLYLLGTFFHCYQCCLRGYHERISVHPTEAIGTDGQKTIATSSVWWYGKDELSVMSCGLFKLSPSCRARDLRWFWATWCRISEKLNHFFFVSLVNTSVRLAASEKWYPADPFRPFSF